MEIHLLYPKATEVIKIDETQTKRNSNKHHRDNLPHRFGDIHEGMKTLVIISKNELGRVLLHLPLGLLTCLLGYTCWWLALIFACGFLVYEVNEDWHISDQAWVDIKGFLWGIGIGGITMFILKIAGVL